jgi:hypothetical protein
MRVCSSHLSANFIDYSYAHLRTKSPDCQFTPKSLTIPPSLPKPGTIRPGYLGTPFPTVVFEVSHRHETWSQLLQDARTKAFSGNTTIQVWVGLKIYAHRLQGTWGYRSKVGHGMTIGGQVPTFSIYKPTGRHLRIPTHLIFWGSVIPPHLVTQIRFPIPLEDFRVRLLPLIG